MSSEAVLESFCMTEARDDKIIDVEGFDKDPGDSHAPRGSQSSLSLDDIMVLAKTYDLTDRRLAIRLYQDWIEDNQNSPHLAVAWFNLGVEFANAKDDHTAAQAYRTALALKPSLYPASINLGLVEERANAPERALEVWQQALQPDEARVALLNQSARLLEQSGQLAAAEATLAKSLSTTVNQPDAIQHWLHLRQQMCQWPALPAVAFGACGMELLHNSGPLGALAMTDKIATQTRVAANWIARKTSVAPRRLSPADGYQHEKLRLGYMSSDFGRHAMGYLIADLFSHHDRNRFTVNGYCLGRDDGSALRARIVRSFDKFTSLVNLSDEAAACQIADDQIDILIDLNGLTRGARPQILRWRPAPVQTTYLGYIGSAPIPELDYMLCDNYVVPEHLSSQYKPEPLYIRACQEIAESGVRFVR
jgi:predicted O-linked N-acetylglucosamine transferase (SPINDLY family)